LRSVAASLCLGVAGSQSLLGSISPRSLHIGGLLLTYRLAVNALLLGWEISPGVKPIKFEGGRVLEYTDGDLFWADRYSFDAVVTNYLPDPPAYGGLNFVGEH
jgi:hypothetical protein